MTRRLPLGAWLGLGFVLAVTLPAVGALAAWWAVDARQQGDLDRRADRAAALIAAAPPGARAAGTIEPDLARGLAALDVEAELSLPDKGVVGAVRTTREAKDATTLKDAKLASIAGVKGADPVVKPPPLLTAGLRVLLRKSDGKRALQTRFIQRPVAGATLYLPKPSAPTRVSAAVIAALVLLIVVVVATSTLLRRWVVRPLAQLSCDVDQVAGGTIAVGPVSSRAREVADVAGALSGMADGLRGALAERDAAEEQRRFLVTSIAHDLRTPLFTLRGSLEAIEHGIGDADHLARAQHKAALLDSLVDDLFTYSRLEYAQPELAREPLDAVALARDAAQTVDPRIVITAPVGGVVVHGDRASLLRVLVNLLDNAIRHARSRVELQVTYDDGDVVFVVDDDGPGIDPDDLPHLFEPLFRADRTRNSATGGAGLGLAIVDRLATAHGAVVTAGAAPGGGARFTVRCAA